MTSQLLIYIFVILIGWIMLWTMRSSQFRIALMLGISYLLYSSWGLRSLGLLIVSSLMNYFLAAYLRRRPNPVRLWAGVVANIALLSVFKYLSTVLPVLFSVSSDAFLDLIALPVGMSFWTFQALSYLFDIYRGEEIEPSLSEFLLYMAYWPTALSGPICRVSDLVPQLRQFPKPAVRDVPYALDRVFTGLVMTTVGRVLAQGLQIGNGLDAAFDSFSGGWTGLDVWCLAVGYGFELFFNFAGYSHIVIGASHVFGIRLPENFDRPFLSASPSDFWTKWHMSLSFWIRDYLFIPLVTLYRAKWWRNAALVLSMIAFGLWHKGSLLFACWGLYQGVLLVLHRQWQQWRRRLPWQFSKGITGPVSRLMTFGVICLGFILFRANNPSQALAMVQAVTSPTAYFSGWILPSSLYGLVFVCAIGYFVCVGMSRILRKYFAGICMPVEVRIVLYSIVGYLGFLHAAETQSFIYFQF